jgi:hypothetical protein
VSFDALAWAAKQRPGNLASKMVLLALANYANEAGEAYPSNAAIADFGDMNPKTAIAAIDRLEEMELIADTGKRCGRSGQIKVYKLNLESIPKTEASQKRKHPKNGNKDSQKREGEDSQKRVTDTVRDTVKNQSKVKSPPSDDAPLTVSELVEDWNSFAEVNGLPRVLVLSDARRKKAASRLKRYPDIRLWQRAFANIRGSPFCLGQNDRGWKADFDFLLQDKSFSRLIEGSYGQAH